jgi:hypothetical protein
MKKSKPKRRPNPQITYRMAPKRLVDQHCLPPGTVLIDRVFDRDLGRFRDFEPGDQIEGNFYLDPEEENVRPLPDAQREAVAAATKAALDALTSEETGPRTRRDEVSAMVVQVILTGDAVRAIFDARRPAPRDRKGG